MDSKKAIQLTIKNILKEGLNDTFPKAFEVDFLDDIPFRNKVYELVKLSIDSSLNKETGRTGTRLQKLKINPINTVLFPKSEAFSFRKCALIEPLDLVKYSSLVLMIAEEIEKHRIPKNKNIVFSYRFSPSGDLLFDSKYNFKEFNDNVKTTIKEDNVKVLVKTDISSFYDRLNLHRLESVLLSLPISKPIIKLINELLLFWANRDSYGLPIGSNPSRILAEASLIDVDNYLLSHGVRFCRFVDDYRFFAPNSEIAHYWISLLIERLSIEGLYINQTKTTIEDVSYLSENPDEKNEDEKDNSIREEDLEYNYNGSIPKVFIKASKEEIKRILELPHEDIFQNIEETNIISSELFKDYCDIIFYRQLFNKFDQLPKYLKRFPQFNPFVVDLLIKSVDDIPDKIKESLRVQFCNTLLSANHLPEYIAISIVRLLSSNGFISTKELFAYFRGLKRNAGAFIGRATLEALENLINRGQVLEIRKYYERADLWEKRQIVRIVSRKLHREEKNAWFKNIKMNEADRVFLIQSIS